MYLGQGPSLQYFDWDIDDDSSNNANADPGDHLYPSLFFRNIGCEVAENMLRA